MLISAPKCVVRFMFSSSIVCVFARRALSVAAFSMLLLIYLQTNSVRGGDGECESAT